MVWFDPAPWWGWCYFVACGGRSSLMRGFNSESDAMAAATERFDYLESKDI